MLMSTKHSRLRLPEYLLQILSKQRALIHLLCDTQMEKWQEFVSQIEQGYPMSLHDYANRLSTRDNLQLLMSGIRGSALTHWRQGMLLSLLDAQFRRVTREVPNPVLPPLEDERLGWWWYAIPRSVSTSLSPAELNTWIQYSNHSKGMSAKAPA